jgi:hypothetical protein
MTPPCIGVAMAGVAGVMGTSARVHARAATTRLIHTSRRRFDMDESFLTCAQY